MKKLLLSSLAAAALSLASLSASAATSTPATANFNVSVILAAACQSTTVGVPVLGFGPYAALGTGADNTGSVALTFKCTRSLTTPTFQIDATAGTVYGVLAGLNYSLTAAPSATPSVAGDPALASSGGVGSATTYSYTISGVMAAGQAGDCASATSSACNVLKTTATPHTLTVSY